MGFNLLLFLIFGWALAIILVDVPTSFWDFNVLEVFATLAIIIAVGIAILRFVNRKNVHDFKTVEKHPDDVPIVEAKEKRWRPKKSTELKCVSKKYGRQFLVQVNVKRGVNLDNLAIGLVKRRWFWHWRLGAPKRLWYWQRLEASKAYLQGAWDYLAESTARENVGWGKGIIRPKSDYQDGEWILSYNPPRLLREPDSLWLKVSITATTDCKVFLQVRFPVSVQQWAYKRHGLTIEMQPEIDTEDS